MNNLLKIILIFLLSALTAAPLVVLASSPSLVPCGLSQDYQDCVDNKCPDGTACSGANDACLGYGGINEKAPCSLCHLYILIQRILGFIMWTVAPIVAVLGVAWGGFNILIAGENPGKRAEGFKIIQKTVVGLVIMFAGWVLMNEVLFFFTSSSGTADITNPTKILQSPWNKVECELPEQK